MPDDHISWPHSRRINPLIDRYVTTDLPLLDIIRKTPTIDNPCTQALLLIAECLAGERLAKDWIAAAEAAPEARSPVLRNSGSLNASRAAIPFASSVLSVTPSLITITFVRHAPAWANTARTAFTRVALLRFKTV